MESMGKFLIDWPLIYPSHAGLTFNHIPVNEMN